MKQTAVEWLESQLFELRNPTLTQIEIIEEAKEMEKQQIIEAYTEGFFDERKGKNIKVEDYYNKTFNK